MVESGRAGHAHSTRTVVSKMESTHATYDSDELVRGAASILDQESIQLGLEIEAEPPLRTPREETSQSGD